MEVSPEREVAAKIWRSAESTSLHAKAFETEGPQDDAARSVSLPTLAYEAGCIPAEYRPENFGWDGS